MSSSSFARRAARALAVAGVGLLGAGAQAASAATLRVDDDHVQCATAPFTTISAAIVAAAPGDRIGVCPGTYREQVHIDKAGLQVVAAADIPGEVVVRAPDPMTGRPALVTISAPSTMLRGIKVAGGAPNSQRCNPSYTGVAVNTPATSRADAPVLARDTIVGIWSLCSEFRTPEEGGGQFATMAGTALALESTAVVRTTRIRRVGSQGIVVTGASTHAFLSHLVVIGGGIAVSKPGVGGGTDGFGGGVTVVGPGPVVDVVDSEIRDFPFVSDFVGGDRVAIARYGVFATQGSTLRVLRSRIHNNAAGIGLNGTQGALIADNAVTQNDNVGIAIVAGQGNQILRNVATGNGNSSAGFLAPLDCVDLTHGSGTAGTANVWQDNVGDVEFPPSFPPETCPPPPVP
jgi:parallel beta-helix repeat protein